jgi:bleomycin hydrolase|tara:strand:+ start:11515 stop:12846 length:1332 start_codon:yes stop_codon:yes gene_type:complete
MTTIQTTPISTETIQTFRDAFEQDTSAKVSQNAVGQTTIDDVALVRDVVQGTDFTFSTRLDEWKASNQRQSGRCWLFAALNMLRVPAMKKMNVKEFEFSQNWAMFWDKFERANWFLQHIIDTADCDIDDRTVAFLLGDPIGDGGQWNMFVNVVHKHGLVPKTAMPETQSSSCTAKMNMILKWKLRSGAELLREAGADMETVREEVLGGIWRILCIHLGTPPTKFMWQWQDKDKKFHRTGEMTPLEFANEYIETPLDEYVCVVNDPRETSPLLTTYTVECLGNVVGGELVKYLNIDTTAMKTLTQKMLEDGKPVWMGCDVGKMFRRDIGIWDAKLFNFEDVYGTKLGLTKAQRLDYHQTLMTHAMLFTGVDVLDGVPVKWRVENSWGDENVGEKGFHAMNDSWFDEYMFEVAIEKKYLSADMLAAWEEEPTVLSPWDPMGSLAK